jgi:hypothetical protein
VLLGRRATDRALAGGYNFAIFLSTKRTGARTLLIVDPPDGRIPPLIRRRRRSLPPSGNSVSPCCSRPRHVRKSYRVAAAASLTRCPRHDAQTFRPAITPCA